jgi:uncharacterized protein with von Willebrand factor type A (vWA) domain
VILKGRALLNNRFFSAMKAVIGISNRNQSRVMQIGKLPVQLMLHQNRSRDGQHQVERILEKRLQFGDTPSNVPAEPILIRSAARTNRSCRAELGNQIIA